MKNLTTPSIPANFFKKHITWFPSTNEYSSIKSFLMDENIVEVKEKLYGAITYMHVLGVQDSENYKIIENFLKEEFGENYVPDWRGAEISWRSAVSSKISDKSFYERKAIFDEKIKALTSNLV